MTVIYCNRFAKIRDSCVVSFSIILDLATRLISFKTAHHHFAMYYYTAIH